MYNEIKFNKFLKGAFAPFFILNNIMFLFTDLENADKLLDK